MSDSGNTAGIIELYTQSEKIYPREVSGRFQRLRTLTVWLLLCLYYLLPWINLNGRQLVLFDLPARKFYIFGLTFWPQDFILLSGLLLLAALGLFFFTALAGRLWCGYACPQTVWTEVFMWLERFAEGKASKRKKRDHSPWSWGKAWRKTLKHFLWLVFALWTGFTFVGYFTPIESLATKVITTSTGGWETFWILFYSFATWGNAGKMREQVCKYMCPYARFQSAMFDRDTLVVSYDLHRGEPRGSRSRKLAHAELATKQLGDCIDCTLCVQVCPTGIDIRQGLQYECIGCAACIDVCDQVMEQMHYPKGLIQYTTENRVDGNASRIVRPRIVMYASILLLLIAAWVVGVIQRPPLIVDVMRDRNALYRDSVTGEVENSYLLRIMNRTGNSQRLNVSVTGLENIHIIGDQMISLCAGCVGSLPVTVAAPRGSLDLRNDIEFSISAADNPLLSSRSESRFLSPVGRLQ